MGFLVGCGRSRNHGAVFKAAMKLGDICFATRSGWRASASEHFNGGNADLELPVVRQPREKRMMKTVRPLASIWCVECSTGAAAYVRKLPAAMGLNVIIVKPNEGSPLRHGSLLGPDSDGSALFAYLAAAGRPVSCDLSTELQAELSRLSMAHGSSSRTSQFRNRLTRYGEDAEALHHAISRRAFSVHRQEV